MDSESMGALGYESYDLLAINHSSTVSSIPQERHGVSLPSTPA
jgi:hypothetical protein